MATGEADDVVNPFMENHGTMLHTFDASRVAIEKAKELRSELLEGSATAYKGSGIPQTASDSLLREVRQKVEAKVIENIIALAGLQYEEAKYSKVLSGMKKDIFTGTLDLEALFVSLVPKTDAVDLVSAFESLRLRSTVRQSKVSKDDAGDDGNDKSPLSEAERIKAKRTRRRLSVLRDKIVLEESDESAAQDDEAESASSGSSLTLHKADGKTIRPKIQSTCITEMAGINVKGFQPYNPKKKNQDAFIMAEHRDTSSLLLAVYDGHGGDGEKVSWHFANKIPLAAASDDVYSDNPVGVLNKHLVRLEKVINLNARVDTEFSGSTMIMCHLKNNHITAMNVGDSRMIIGWRSPKGSFKLCMETEDHKPDDPSERARIESSGGRVEAMVYDDGVTGPARVWLKTQDVPGLAMSRSLCDQCGHRAGVLSEPTVSEYDFVGSQEHVIIIASDGLYEFLSNEEILDMVSISRARGDSIRQQLDILYAESRKRWMEEEGVVDDTTIIIAYAAAK